MTTNTQISTSEPVDQSVNDLASQLEGTAAVADRSFSIITYAAGAVVLLLSLIHI